MFDCLKSCFPFDGELIMKFKSLQFFSRMILFSLGCILFVQSPAVSQEKEVKEDEQKTASEEFFDNVSQIRKLVSKGEFEEAVTLLEEKVILEDLITAAHNNAKSQLKSKTAEEISKASGNFGIPGFKWPL